MLVCYFPLHKAQKPACTKQYTQTEGEGPYLIYFRLKLLHSAQVCTVAVFVQRKRDNSEATTQTRIQKMQKQMSVWREI